MASFKITKKHHKHINNPFPCKPKTLPFIEGNLLFNSQTLHSEQIFAIGHDFQLNWSSENGGSVSIFHKSQLSRSIWSTVAGRAFISASVADTEVEESRGSFAIKDREIHLEGYNYSVFDLTKPDSVQIQIHGDFVEGRILHGNSPAELIEHFTETIGRPKELPEWIISGAVVGMQGGTDTVRHIWKELQTQDTPVSAFLEWVEIVNKGECCL